jgi:sugar/nucleoside kinase (ribokinase family)
VGSAARDITVDDPRGWRLGGGVSYGGLTLARLGLRTSVIVGGDALAADAAELELLREAGADVHVVRLDRSPVFENIETPNGRIQLCLEPGDPIPTSALPDGLRGVPTWLLAPVADELPDAWADQPPDGALVALGWQGILRVLPRGGRTRRRPPARSPLVSRADIVGVSRHDLAPGTSLARVAGFMKGGATLLATEGVGGGSAITVDGPSASAGRRYPAIPATAEHDPTGAGDVFLAAYLAARVRPWVGSDADRLAFAAAAASLNVEGLGLLGVPDLTAVLERLGAVSSPAASRVAARRNKRGGAG